MSQTPVFSVSGLNRYIKAVLDREEVLRGVCVRGEVSNYKCYPSGHHYFSLKDAEGTVRCVLFRREAVGLRFRPENGMGVAAFGYVTVFPRDGQYQLYCSQLLPDGVGARAAALEQLKARLAAEGLFDQARKRPLPPYPGKIALITSPAGAAVRDMLRILKARWPAAQVLLIPASVQGEEAPGELCRAFSLVEACEGIDLVITGRGGGSAEDLWCFNEERVVRAIAACPVPVISAVGHEPDVTLADFAADLRAATPSNGAELATPDRRKLLELLAGLEGRLTGAARRRLDLERGRLEGLCRRRALTDPMVMVELRRLTLDRQRERLAAAMEERGRRRRLILERLAASLDALSPLKVLGRGYGLARREDGSVLGSVEAARPGERIQLRLSDGTLDCRVEGVTRFGGKKEAHL